jgi:hypothetical protein
VYSNSGKLVRRMEAAQIPSVIRGDSRHSVAGTGGSSDAAAKLREAVAKVRGSSMKHKPDLSMTLVVADAMDAPSAAEAHRVLRTLPVRIDRQVQRSATGDFVTTSVYVRGTIKLRLTQPLAGAPSGDASATSTAEPTPFPEGDAIAGPTVAPPERSAFFCDEETDPCATQEDRDDALSAAAAMQADLDAAAADEAADESDCFSDGMCYVEDGASHLDASLSESAGNPFTAPDMLPGQFNCFVEYTAAAGGILWAASGILGLAAIAASPEPVSKLGLWAAWTNAAAGVTAAIGGVYAAAHCHYAT